MTSSTANLTLIGILTEVIMNTLGTIIAAAFWVTAINMYEKYYDKYVESKNKTDMDDRIKMKQKLVKMLKKDGFECELKEGVVCVEYGNELFRIHFSDGFMGDRFTRVTVANSYSIKGMEEVHPLIIEGLMGRANFINPRIGNVGFPDHCDCFYGTELKDIKPFYRHLTRILNNLIETERYVRQEFEKFKNDNSENTDDEKKNHIGFKMSADRCAENEHQVAAEAKLTKPDA